MRVDTALLIKELSQAQKLDSQVRDAEAAKAHAIWNQLLEIHGLMERDIRDPIELARKRSEVPDHRVSVEIVPNLSVGFRYGPLYLSFEANSRGVICMYRINSQGRSDLMQEFPVVSEDGVRTRILGIIRDHFISQSHQEMLKKQGAIPSDMEQLARDVKSAREMEVRVAEEKKRRQAVLEKTMADVQIWLVQLVADLQDLARADPANFNPNNYAPTHVARMLELAPSEGVGFMFDGLAIKFKPLDGMMYMDAGNSTNTMITDPVEATIRAVALKAVRHRTAPQSLFAQSGGGDFSKLMSD